MTWIILLLFCKELPHPFLLNLIRKLPEPLMAPFISESVIESDACSTKAQLEREAFDAKYSNVTVIKKNKFHKRYFLFYFLCAQNIRGLSEKFVDTYD